MKLRSADRKARVYAGQGGCLGAACRNRTDDLLTSDLVRHHAPPQQPSYLQKTRLERDTTTVSTLQQLQPNCTALHPRRTWSCRSCGCSATRPAAASPIPYDVSSLVRAQAKEKQRWSSRPTAVGPVDNHSMHDNAGGRDASSGKRQAVPGIARPSETCPIVDTHASDSHDPILSLLVHHTSGEPKLVHSTKPGSIHSLRPCTRRRPMAHVRS